MRMIAVLHSLTSEGAIKTSHSATAEIRS